MLFGVCVVRCALFVVRCLLCGVRWRLSLAFAVCSLLVVCCLSVVVCRWRLRLAFEVGVCWLFFAGEIDGWCCAFVRYCVLFVSVRWRCLFRVVCGR